MTYNFVTTLYEYIYRNSPPTTKKQALLVTKAKSVIRYQELVSAKLKAARRGGGLHDPDIFDYAKGGGPKHRCGCEPDGDRDPGLGLGE
jgi:hypothetical protein